MKEILDIDPNTGEILLSVEPQEYHQLQETKIKAVQLLNPSDFAMINGTYEAKRDALIKILSSLPISYSWKISDKSIKDSFSSITGVLTIRVGNVVRESESIGTCEIDELRGNRTRHIMIATAETRALKRAIETLFGSVINWYVVNALL